MVYLFAIETANTAIDMAMMYQPLIAGYGAFARLLHSLNGLRAELATGTQRAVENFPTRM